MAKSWWSMWNMWCVSAPAKPTKTRSEEFEAMMKNLIEHSQEQQDGGLMASVRALAGSAVLALSASLTAASAWAQEAAAPAADAAAAAPAAAPVLNSGDTAWMLTSTALVLLMTIPGLALFYGGMVRKKNILTVLMQCFVITALVTVLWLVVGYSIAFTDGNPYMGGMSRVLMNGVENATLIGTIPETVYMMFQMTFAIITPALIVGAFADRMKFSALILFMSLWLVVIYSPIAHMIWYLNAADPTLSGLLAAEGDLDFAGGTVVHINAGIAGLVACIVLGKRTGFGTENMAPHNLVLTMIGTSMLWVGWFGFNAGSALTADGRAGMAMLNTQVATAGAVLSWMFAEWMLRGKPSVLGALSGGVAGLVAITPACGFVLPGPALIIGLAAGLVCLWGVTGLKKMIGADDALDVFGVHCLGGILGALLTGVFAVKANGGTDGLLAGNPAQMLVQVKGVLLTLAWSGIGSYILLKITDLIVGLRVTPEQEREGLDLTLHGEALHS
jgi:Amt family ammonium transporter